MIARIFSKRLLPQVLVQVLPATIVVLLVGGYVGHWTVKESALTEHRAHLNEVAAQSATAISLNLENIVHTAQSLAANDLIINSLIDVSERDRYIPMLFQSLRIQSSAHARVTLADYRGRFIASNTPGTNYADAGWVRNVMNGQTVISITAAGMIAAVPVHYSNLPEGIIVIEFDAKGVADLLALQVEADGYAVQTTEGLAVYSSEASIAPSDSDARDLQTDSAWMWGLAAIDGFPSIRLFVGDRMATVLAPVDRQGKFLLLAFLLCILAVTAGIVVTTFKVSKPVVKLIGEVETIGSTTDLTYRMKPYGSEEFHRLTVSFNKMLSQLENATSSRDYVDGILNSMTEFMVVVSPDGQVRSGNRSMANILGCSVEDLAGRKISSILSGDWHELIPLVASDSSSVERILTNEENASIPVRVSVSAMNPKNDVFGTIQDDSANNLILVLRDITEQVRAKVTLDEQVEALRLAKSAAEVAAVEAREANAAKSNFLAIMSHEIRTPMNGVLGMADILAGTELTAQQREFVGTLKESGKSLMDLLNDILDLSKIEAGSVELENRDFPVGDLLKSTNALWSHSAQDKGLSFSIQNTVTDNNLVRGDRNRLRQILNNLIGNAIKFTSEGQVELHVAEFPGMNEKVGLRFDVRDSGIGISEDQIDKVFDPFTQADSSTTRNYGGTGLGLPICKNLAELLGGEIGVESTPGNGSIFWFTVTLDHGIAKEALPNTPHETPTTSVLAKDHRTLRILVAEDNQLNQKIISWMLAPLDCQFDIVANGLEAVAAVTRSSYDLVLMDVQMPEMDGVAATKQIRVLGGSLGLIPIIAMTANAMQGDREKYLDAGMIDYVSKPIDQRELFSTITRCADVAMPEFIDQAFDADSGGEQASAPQSLDDGQALNDLLGALDDLLDGTGR